MNDTPDQPAPPKRRPAWHWAVYLVLLATSTYAVVLVCQKMSVYEDPAAPAGRHSRQEYDTGRLDPSKGDDFWTKQGDAPKDMPSLIARSIRAGTLEQQDKDPGDLPPPTGSVRRGSWRQMSPMRLMRRAVYECRQTVAEGADHYVGMLLDEGFQCNDDTRTPGGPVKLHFSKGSTHALVTLQKHPGDATTSLITFILLTDRKSNDTAKPPAKED